MPNLIVSAVSTFDNRGLKKGQKEINAFDKTLKTLGKTFAGVFGAQKILQFSKNAVNAFMADEKAAKALEIQLKNTGFAFAAPEVEFYIANLQKTTGVLDDQLRPAFQQLLTVTQSISESQKALNTALNVSAATGASLTEVSAALSKGFAGNTTALSRLNAGIDKATLKSGDMNKILEELNNRFAGQAQARLTTYAGKMDLLKIGAENAKEEIGKGLLDALNALGNDKSIEKASTAMEGFGKSIGDAIFGLATLINKLDGLARKTKSAGIVDILSRLQPGGKGASILAGALTTYGNKERNKPTSNFTYSLGSSATKDIDRANKLLKEKNKLEADAIAKLKAKTEVDKLKDKFDVERINLQVALNAATDEETKLRIRAQLAILDNNEALAKKYNAELNAKTAIDELAVASKSAAAALLNYGPALFNSLGELTARGRNQIAPFENYTYTVPQGATNQQAAVTATATPTATVTVNAGTIVTDQQLQAVIEQNVLNLLKSGNKLLPAGSL